MLDASRENVWEVIEGCAGAAIMLLAFATPFLRSGRARWGVEERWAAAVYPGDELIAAPDWSYTHGIDIDRPPAEVWPWVAQVGVDRAGFYSYQWLENLVGCNVRNANTLRPDWELKVGQTLRLHPDAGGPQLQIVALEAGRYFVAHATTANAVSEKPWSTVTWLFLLVPTARGCRLISRFRTVHSNDLATRLAFGPTLLEPVAFAMDRRMLLGIKERVEKQ